MTDSTATGVPAAFTITRTLKAPRDVVWRAWTDEDELARWLYDFARTPRDSNSFDVREGGRYRYTLISDDTGEHISPGVCSSRSCRRAARLHLGEADDPVTRRPS